MYIVYALPAFSGFLSEFNRSRIRYSGKVVNGV